MAEGIFRKDAAVESLYINLNQTKCAVFTLSEPFTSVLNKQLQPLAGCMARSFIINDQKMLIDATHSEEMRVVIVDGTRLDELDIETSTKNS